MTDEQAIRHLHAAANDLLRHGYVVTGDLHFCRPKQPGLLESEVKAFLVPCPRMEFRVSKREGGGGSPVAPPGSDPPPSLDHHEAVGIEGLTNENTGDVCWKCGSPNMQRAGPCLACRDCGETSGGCS